MATVAGAYWRIEKSNEQKKHDVSKLEKIYCTWPSTLERAIKQIIKLRILYGYLMLGALPDTVKKSVNGYILLKETKNMKTNRIRSIITVSLMGVLFCSLCYGADPPEQSKANPDWRHFATRALDTMIDHGKDVYGPVKTPMLMAVIDIDTLTSPEHPKMYDSRIRTEDRPNGGRRSPRGSNLWHDQPLIKAMYYCTKITGDSRYSDAADAYINYALEHCVRDNGLLIWGVHLFYNAYADKLGDAPITKRPLHEISNLLPDWANMYRLNPKAVRKEIDGIWQRHIADKKTGRNNRHDDGEIKGGCDFTFAAGEFILAFAFMHSVTGEQHYLDKAKLVTDWHWQHRNKDTNLVAEAPALKGKYGSNHSYTSVSGPFASCLLRSYELTGDKTFRDIAIAVIKAYDKYGWDEKAQTYYGTLTLEGKPVFKPFQSGYDSKYYPVGHIDLWRTIMYSYEYPLIAAQTNVYAYELSADENGQRDKELLKGALRWAGIIEKNMPPKIGRRWKPEIEKAVPEIIKTGGTYAENYGRAISFFVHLYRATKDKKHLQLAEKLATEAVEKLYHKNGLFRGHPAKPYYQTNDGVGLLIYALFELDDLSKPKI
jgi:hypothetical protein